MPLPALLIIGVFGLMLLWFTRQKGLASVFIAFAFLGIFLVSFQPIATSLLRPLERENNAFVPSNQSVDFVMVLGSGHVIDHAMPITSELSRTALMRLAEGIRIQRLYPGSKLILSGYPGIDSIKDLGSVLKSPWKKKIVRIDGNIVALDHIEHKILRPRYKDPRVHFAINCASKSCPPLISEPFRGDILNQQLDAATTAFLNNPEQNRLEDNTLYVSRIFKWYSEDFNDDVVGFFIKYANASLKDKLVARRNRIKIKHLDYDWSLNGK